jgi:hypothetical protein
MARIPTRLHGPALVPNAAATIYTVPALTKTIVRYIHVQNPTGAAVTFTLSIGADAAGTRIYDAISIPAGTAFERFCYHVLSVGEILQRFAGTNNVMTLTIDGDEIVLG